MRSTGTPYQVDFGASPPALPFYQSPSQAQTDEVNLLTDMVASLAKFHARILCRGPRVIDARYINEAVSRYVSFLGLARDSNCRNIPLVPTLDVDLVWRAHMLSPLDYRDDCLDVVGRVLPHSTISPPEAPSNITPSLLDPVLRGAGDRFLPTSSESVIITPVSPLPRLSSTIKESATNIDTKGTSDASLHSSLEHKQPLILDASDSDLHHSSNAIRLQVGSTDGEKSWADPHFYNDHQPERWKMGRGKNGSIDDVEDCGSDSTDDVSQSSSAYF
jgi:hypothetical protein